MGTLRLEDGDVLAEREDRGRQPSAGGEDHAGSRDRRDGDREPGHRAAGIDQQAHCAGRACQPRVTQLVGGWRPRPGPAVDGPFQVEVAVGGPGAEPLHALDGCRAARPSRRKTRAASRCAVGTQLPVRRVAEIRQERQRVFRARRQRSAERLLIELAEGGDTAAKDGCMAASSARPRVRLAVLLRARSLLRGGGRPRVLEEVACRGRRRHQLFPGRPVARRRHRRRPGHRPVSRGCGVSCLATVPPATHPARTRGSVAAVGDPDPPG